MSKADKMFEELGYEHYLIIDEAMIRYWKEDKEFEKEKEILFFDDEHTIAVNYVITISELKAINEKVKEYGKNDKQR